MDDRQLLQEYVDLGSELAFKTLVERHLGLVHSAARRQVKDAQLAEDVSQAVFMLLARKAGSLPRESRLSGWLYQTTCFVARRALRSELRRKERERTASAMQPHETSVSHDPWNDLAPHLDEALGRLGDKDQRALLIRYFERRTHRDVADALGIGEEAAKKRTHRALEKLRLLLQRQGVAISGVGLAAALGEHGAEAAPAGLAGVITPTGGVIGATGVAARVPGLVEETLRAWWWTKVSWVSGFLAGSAAVVLGVAMLVFNREPAPGNMAQSVSPPAMALLNLPGTHPPTDVPIASKRARPAGEQVLLFRVVDDATGSGVASARLVLQKVVDGEWTFDLGRTTDAAGFVEIGYGKGTLRLDVGILENGWVARYATFQPHLDDAIPAEYTLRVTRSTATYGGWVRDEGGRPVAGAAIRIAFDNSGDSSIRETPRERVGCPVWRALVATTDPDGRWSMAITAPGRLGFSLVARHPDFADGAVVIPEIADRERALDAKPSGATPSTTVLRRGGQITGRVLGPDGLPVAGAAVMTDVSSVEEQSVKTDADGRFALPRKETGEVEFTVMAPGFAPEVRTVLVHPALEPLDVMLRPGGVLRLRLVDEAGVGVPGAEVILEQWKEYRHRVKWRAFADEAGRVVWDWAPPEGELDLCVRGKGWCYTRDTRVEAGDTEHRIEMRREFRLKGSVIDTETRRPLAEFKVFPGYGLGEHCWERLETRRGDQGGFEAVFTEKHDPWRVRVEAEGYLPFVSGPIPPGSEQPMEVALQRIQPGTDIMGVVVGPDGAPASGAEVALLTVEHDVRLSGGGFSGSGEDPLIVTADVSGAFRFPSQPGAHSVAVVRKDGFGTARLGSSREPIVVPLKPWGRIDGVVDASARRRPIEALWLRDPAAFEYRGRVLPDAAHQHGAMDSEGRFCFENVPAIDWVVWIHSGPGTTLHHKTPVSVLPGQTTPMRIVAQGPTLRGRFRVAALGDGDRTVNPAGGDPISFAYILSRNPPPPPDRPDGFASTLEAVEYWHSAAGRAWAARGLNVRLHVAVNGSFTTDEEVPAGEYWLRAGVHGREVKQVLVVPEPEAGRTEVDLGEIALDGAARAGLTPSAVATDPVVDGP